MKTGFICQFIIGFFLKQKIIYIMMNKQSFFLQLMAFLIFPILNKVFLYNFFYFISKINNERIEILIGS